jgi:hypothetical protein
MNYDTQIQASMWLLIMVQTIGAIDPPGKGAKRLLPAPRMYVAVVIVWSILGLLVDAGFGKAAALMGWVTVLAAMLTGGFGTIATGFLNTVANRFSTAPSQQPTPPGTTIA